MLEQQTTIGRRIVAGGMKHHHETRIATLATVLRSRGRTEYLEPGAVERRGSNFLNGHTEDSTRHFCICLREYIANSSFSDKYLIAEF